MSQYSRYFLNLKICAQEYLQFLYVYTTVYSENKMKKHTVKIIKNLCIYLFFLKKKHHLSKKALIISF